MTEARAEITGRKPAQTATALEPFSVSPREACRLLSIGTTRLYELLADGELQSYVEGNRARRILLQSIRAYIDRRLAQDMGLGGKRDHPHRAKEAPAKRKHHTRAP
jgi:excisionase family DNA binding protein